MNTTSDDHSHLSSLGTPGVSQDLDDVEFTLLNQHFGVMSYWCRSTRLNLKRSLSSGNVPQTLSSLYHFLVAFTRVHYPANSIYEYFITVVLISCYRRSKNIHFHKLTVNNVVMHGIVSFQQQLIQLSPDECPMHAGESKHLITTR